MDTKELSRQIIARAYPEAAGVFDTLWDALADVPLQSAPLASNDALSGLALGAAGAVAAPDTTAVFVLTQARHNVEARTSWELFKKAIETAARILGIEDLIVEVIVAGEQISNDRPRSHQSFAIAYTHEGPEHRDLTKDEATGLHEKREEFLIFIYQSRGLPDRRIGQVYFHPDGRHPALPSRPVSLPPLQYRLLVQLLKHRHDEQRALADFVEHCWFETKNAKKLSNRKTRLTVDTQRYEVGLSRLSSLLQSALGIAALSGGTSVWELVPWPASYCVVEER